MQFARESSQKNAITRYDEQTMTIAGQVYRGGAIISRHEIIHPWTVTDAATLSAEQLAPILALKPEVIVLATGSSVVFPPGKLMRSILQSGVGFEAMNDGAAVRTYNILLGEDREVVLAMLRGEPS